MKTLFLTLAVLLLAGCRPHVDSVYLGSAEANLLDAVNRGDLQTVKEFLDQGGNVNIQDEPGMTPLHHAINADSNGSHVEMVRLLIEQGANVNAIDDTRKTPLHLARCKETAELLIDAGANVNAKTLGTGETILYSAAWGAAQGHPKSHQSYLDLTKMLVARGADTNMKLKTGSTSEESKPYHAKTGETTLHRVARSYSEEHASEVCAFLISNGARVNERNIRGQTPLDEALLNDRRKTASFLHQHGGRTADALKAENE